jgi:hypothetical protein
LIWSRFQDGDTNGGNRTHDTRITSAMLYQLSYMVGLRLVSLSLLRFVYFSYLLCASDIELERDGRYFRECSLLLQPFRISKSVLAFVFIGFTMNRPEAGGKTKPCHSGGAVPHAAECQSEDRPYAASPIRLCRLQQVGSRVHDLKRRIDGGGLTAIQLALGVALGRIVVAPDAYLRDGTARRRL